MGRVATRGIIASVANLPPTEYFTLKKAIRLTMGYSISVPDIKQSIPILSALSIPFPTLAGMIYRRVFLEKI